jgi:hypothetical protein
MSDVLGNGAILSYSIDGGTTYVPFAGVLSIKPAKPTIKKVDNTDLSSTTETTVPSLPNFGSLDATIKYKPTTTSLILGWFTAGTLLKFKLELNDQITPSTGAKSKGVYDGYVEAFDPFSEIKTGELVKNDITVAVNGFAFTAAT